MSEEVMASPEPWKTRLAVWGRRTWPEILLGVLCLVAIVARFVGLESSPPTLWGDESLAGLHLGCLGQTGASGYGQPWPLFADGYAGGFYTPVYLYLGVLWTKVFGLTPGALRAYSAFATVMTLLGLYALGKQLGGRRFGFFALLIGSLSPWSFQFSRIAWDPPFAPPFLVWGCYFWLIQRRYLGAALTGIFFAGALYTYPPFRVQTPLVFAALFFLAGGKLRTDWKRILVFVGTFVPTCIPLFNFLRDPKFLDRSLTLAIFSKEYLEKHQGQLPSGIAVVNILVDNIAAYFKPSFLFITGDTNMRHSIQVFGQLGLLEDLALVFFAFLVFRVIRGTKVRSMDPRPPWTLQRILFFCAAGIFAGVLAGALTNDGVPHSLRSIGVWPFYALAGAAIFRFAEQYYPWFRTVILGTACVHAALYGFLYFHEYPRYSGWDFWEDVTKQITDWEGQKPDAQLFLAKTYKDHFRYLRMARRGVECRESERQHEEAVKE